MVAVVVRSPRARKCPTSARPCGAGQSLVLPVAGAPIVCPLCRRTWEPGALPMRPRLGLSVVRLPDHQRADQLQEIREGKAIGRARRRAKAALVAHEAKPAAWGPTRRALVALARLPDRRSEAKLAELSTYARQRFPERHGLRARGGAQDRLGALIAANPQIDLGAVEAGKVAPSLASQITAKRGAKRATRLRSSWGEFLEGLIVSPQGKRRGPRKAKPGEPPKEPPKPLGPPKPGSGAEKIIRRIDRADRPITAGLLALLVQTRHLKTWPEIEASIGSVREYPGLGGLQFPAYDEVPF